MNLDVPNISGSRPVTRQLARGRSNSFTGIINRLAVLPQPEAPAPEVPVFAAPPPDPAPEMNIPQEDAIPPHQPEDPPEEPVPEPADPPPGQAAAAEEPGPTPEELAILRLTREARRIITECVKLVEVYEDLTPNQAIIDHIREEGNRLVLLTSSCYDRIDGMRELAEASRELERWRVIIKKFIATMLSPLLRRKLPAAALHHHPMNQRRGEMFLLIQ